MNHNHSLKKSQSTPICGAVVIGRNEGERLAQCLDSLLEQLCRIVYVDSGSTDSSVALASARGVMVHELDMSQPFTAARARNRGAKELLRQWPDISFIQFVDGDCELQQGWIKQAAEFLTSHPDYAVACGRRRERYPENSIFNLLCDIEWDTPIGDATACGGDALIRAEAFQTVAGYQDTLIAGEEPEMCYRLRQRGWKIRRLDIEMTLHDAAMTRFTQWWKRAQRAGYAYAEGFALYGGGHEKYRLKEIRGILIWALLLPISTLILSLFFREGLLLFLFYPLQILRLYRHYRRNLLSQEKAAWYALSNIGGKIPQLTGVSRYLLNRLKGRQGTLIEYK